MESPIRYTLHRCAGALCDQGKKVLLVDADPQCNLTAFFIDEAELDKLLGESEEQDIVTAIWSAIKPVVQGRGGIRSVPIRDLGEGLTLIPGDVLLSQYEEELPQAWLD